MPRRVMRRSSAPRRRTIWARTAVAGTVAAAGSDTENLLANYLAGDGSIGVGLTVVRTIMHLQFVTTTAEASNLGLLGGLVVSEDSSPTPPLPLAQGGSDWMDYYWYRAVAPWSTIDPPVGDEIITSYDRDVHSMRRIDEIGQSLFLCFENTGGQTVVYSGYVSTLLKLP